MENISSILPFAVNFTIVVLLLFVLLRKPARRFIYQRHERLKDFVEASAIAYEAAQAKYKQAESQLQQLSQETKAILSSEIKGAEQEAKLILQKAEQEALRQEKESARLAEALASESSEMIKVKFVDLIIGKTGARLRADLQHADHKAIFKRAHTSIGAEV